MIGTSFGDDRVAANPGNDIIRVRNDWLIIGTTI
jgi:hypothetical protein